VSAAEKIPWEQLPLTAHECGELWGVTGEHFLATVACLPDFPERMTYKPATWLAGEVVEYRNANRAGRPVRRRRSGSRA
jgi:hypothetical protein